MTAPLASAPITDSLSEIAHKVRTGALTAVSVVEAVLADIRARNATFNCFTRVLTSEARAAARAIDDAVARGVDPGPLAGVPFAVKDLYDVAGIPTTAGAKIRVNAPPAGQDAETVRRLKAAGAVLIGTLIMDEFAYGFATVNAHFGTARNPHDTSRLAGGSSGGSAVAVAAGLVPLTLGSDTNGSIRVPSSLCGVWGLRPGDGAIPVEGSFPFVETLDTLGPFTRSAADLALAYEILSGASLGKASQRPPRVARLGGWFARNASAEAIAAVDAVMAHLGSDRVIDLPDAEAARSAAFLISGAEGAVLHLPTLRTQALDYDPAVRDRLLAGALIPASTIAKARAFRTRYRARIARLFEDVDVLIAPATPVTAPRIDEAMILLDGKPVSARANLGMYAQPLSLAGIPVAAAPVKRDGLPIGLQFATAAGREPLLFALLSRLERDGILAAKETPAC